MVWYGVSWLGDSTRVTLQCAIIRRLELFLIFSKMSNYKTQKTQKNPRWDFQLVLGFLGFLGLNPPPILDPRKYELNK